MVLTDDNADASGRLTVGSLIPETGSEVRFGFDGQQVTRIVANDVVDLDGAIFSGLVGALPTAHTYLLVDNKGSAPIANGFANLDEGDTVSIAGTPYAISYEGGDGNDVVLVRAAVPAPAYVAVSPVRVLETRASAGQVGYTGSRPVGGQTVQLHLGGVNGVPLDAAAAVLNLTAVDPTGAGYITVWPCGSPRPTATRERATRCPRRRN